MNLVISRKAWYVIGRWSGVEWGSMVYLDVVWGSCLWSGELASRITVRCRECVFGDLLLKAITGKMGK